MNTNITTRPFRLFLLFAFLSAYVAAAGLCVAMAAELDVGSSVRLSPTPEGNYQLYAQSTGSERAPGNAVAGGFGIVRRAVIEGGPADGRWMVEVAADEPNIGGLTGWVDEVNVSSLEVTRLTLTWQDNSGSNNDAEDGFKVERGIGVDGGFLHLADVGENVETYVDDALMPGALHRYRVIAFNEHGDSEPSNVAEVDVPLPGVGPFPASDLDGQLTIVGGSGDVGSLINLSGRGLVGVDGDVKIGGFTISDGPATVLIRGVGPRLGEPPFNVPGVLADPQLTLFSGQTVIAANDNWDAGGAGSEVSIASSRVWAFSLPSGSLEAAILITLDPGQYTVHLAGVGGATGVALLEIYAVPETP
jgi:hypothetical protein